MRLGLASRLRAAPLSVWAARASLYLLLQGALLLAAYSLLGFDKHPDSFPPGQRLDPIHASVHCLWGAVGTYVGFRRPEWSLAFILIFAMFYLILAVLGTFTHLHFGMRLGPGENIFHWMLGPVALLIGVFELGKKVGAR